jgi:hypothetical protein
VTDARAADGFHHPASEDELVELVRTAHRERRSLRVRGAAHSCAHAIYTEGREPPAGDGIDVMLDRYRGLRVVDEERRLVEADAGIHLGEDPSDPSGTATLERGLLPQLAQKGWSLSNTGGITHQTVSGFVATGSSGGSVRFSANENLHGFRVIDGRGDVHELSRDDDEFYAMAPSVGLLGVISKITLECTDLFAIEGEETIAPARSCAIDLFGDGDGSRPSLESFLRDTEYARLEWWPQRGLERVVVWQARRRAPGRDFEPKRYRRFAGSPDSVQYLIGILYAVLGNLDDLSGAKARLEDNFDELERVLEALAQARDLGRPGRVLAEFVAKAIEFGVDTAITFLEPFAPLIKRSLPDFFPKLAGVFVPLGETQQFRDWGWSGLPMDNEVEDRLVSAAFTETWIPLALTGNVMRLLDSHFTEPRDEHEAYRRTGTFVWELYMAMPNRFWLSPSYTSGDDEWRDGAFRVNPYWITDNAGRAEDFFAGLWELLRANGIPFRLHWGKFQPAYAAGDRTWVDLLAAQYPRWDDFLALREQRDPRNVFLTGYWRDRFGLWDAQPAGAG